MLKFSSERIFYKKRQGCGVGTGIIGIFKPRASPFANPKPILNPVKDPGPLKLQEHQFSFHPTDFLID